MWNNKILSTLCCIGIPLLCGAAAADEVRFDGQNVMLGELKHLDRGKLYFKTPGTNTISIEWDHVDLVNSSKNLEIEFSTGEIQYGVIEPTETQGYLLIRTSDDTELVQMSTVVRLTEIEDKIADRFDGTATAGVNLSEPNSYENYSLGLDIKYTTKKYVSSLSLDSHIYRSSDTPKTEKSSLSMQSSRKWKKRRISGGLLSFERNEDLGIDLRTSLGIFVGKNLMFTNSHIFYADVGLLATKEDVTGSDDTDSSREAFVSGSFDWFRYDDPELDLSTTLVVIPSLSESGRVRGNFDLTLRWEMVEDLYWIANYQLQYDSDPPGDGSANSNYTLYTGLAFDF